MASGNRFQRFKGNWFDAAFLDEDLEDPPIWVNPHHVSSRSIDWHRFLSGPPLPPDLKTGIAREIERIDPPLMVLLPHLLKAILEHLRRLEDGPGFPEIIEQLKRLGAAGASLASVAQGGKMRDAPTSDPEWWRYDRDDLYGEHIALGLREEEGRSPFLHPLLQDHLVMAMAPEAYSLVQPGEPEDDAKLREARRSLTNFFQHLHVLLPHIETAKAMTEQLAEEYAEPPRVGTPPDLAKNWVLVRLMWIWRDVLREEPRIYLKQIEGRAPLDRAKPQGCMAFVVAVLEHIETVGHWNYPALERQLLELKPTIPAGSLLRKPLPS